MSGTNAWNAPINNGSFYGLQNGTQTAATPAQLFGTYNSAATPEAHLERCELMVAWLNARQGAPVAAIEAIMVPVRNAIVISQSGTPTAGSSVWGPAAAAAEQALEQFVVNHGLAGGTFGQGFDVAGFLGRLASLGITAASVNGWPAYAGGGGGKMSGEIGELAAKNRRAIGLFLVEAAG